MSITNQIIPTISNLIENTESSVSVAVLLPGEIEGVSTTCLDILGPCVFVDSARIDVYNVFLVLNGQGSIRCGEDLRSICKDTIVRMPHGQTYSIEVNAESKLSLLRIRTTLAPEDLAVIHKNPKLHGKIYVKAFADCPQYTEDTKSESTINRMFLPEHYVPRFCMGYVETQGPDAVKPHSHPMLEQLFLGLDSCRCFCHADGEQALLTEKMLLHIPLGSEHSVSVEKGNVLKYIWMDFFFTLEGQKYMDEQHVMITP
jgi:hypothetical protein